MQSEFCKIIGKQQVARAWLLFCNMGCCKDTKFQFICRLQGTVICSIWPRVLLLAIYTTVLVAMHKYVHGFAMNFPQILIPVLGFVTALLLVFRTNTAYDR